MWMFYEKFDYEGNNQVDNPNIYNVEGDNRLYLDLQQVIAAVYKPRQTEVCRTSGFFLSVWFCSCIF